MTGNTTEALYHAYIGSGAYDSGYRLGSRSRERLIGVHPELVLCIKLALRMCPFDFTISEGLRTVERQRELYAQGRTKAGKIVTWTMNSKHIQGLAADIIPCGKDPYADKAKFSRINKCMQDAAHILGLKVRWGADWNGNGKAWEKGEYDGPHFEITPE